MWDRCLGITYLQEKYNASPIESFSTLLHVKDELENISQLRNFRERSGVWLIPEISNVLCKHQILAILELACHLILSVSFSTS